MNRNVAAGLGLSLALAGCGGGAVTPNTAFPQAVTPNNPAVAQLKPFKGPAALADFDWAKRVRERMTFVKPVIGAAMEIDVVVRMRDAAGLVHYAQSASDPHSGNYRHFLTPQQIADRFGASENDYRAAAHYFAADGMRVGMWPQREVLTVTGSLKQLTRAFGTGFGYFYYGKQLVLAPLQTPHFNRVVPVMSVVHLTSYNPVHDFFIRGNYANFAGYSPQMIASGFDYSGAYAAGFTGKGITTGINGTWQISKVDVPLYGAHWHAQVASVTAVAASPQPPSKANGGTGTGATDPYPAGLTSPPPINAPFCTYPPFPTPPNYNKCNTEDGEAQLDTEQVGSLAPGSNERFYIAYNPSICIDTSTGDIVRNHKNGSCPAGAEFYPLMGIQLADDSLQQAIADNRADTMSLSWGTNENDALADGDISTDPKKPGIEQIEMASLAAEGIAVFVSSGDNGADECADPYTGNWLGIPCVSYPASDPNVTAVGGVNLPIGENGNLIGQITAWADNTTAGGNGTFENNVGSGGGISAVFGAPSWQADTVHNTMREVPDIALDADPRTGPSILVNGPTPPRLFGASGGTSASAPEANGEWALVLQACKQTSGCASATGAKPYRLGNAAPLYYSVYGGKAALSYHQTFYDVIYGNNTVLVTPPPVNGQTPPPQPTGYKAGPGYDMVTGLGVPFGGHLIDSLIKGASAQ
jgi:subtilase family serine protease